MDYTPQAVYWLGGELSENKEFEWTDGSPMTFQVMKSFSIFRKLASTLKFKFAYKGWLPGQGVVDKFPNDHYCLGLQWKKSPTPMLPSGIYWASQKCSKFGGYICKKKRQREGETYVQNKTISGTEGRMTSPGAITENKNKSIKIDSPEFSLARHLFWYTVVNYSLQRKLYRIKTFYEKQCADVPGNYVSARNHTLAEDEFLLLNKILYLPLKCF